MVGVVAFKIFRADELQPWHELRGAGEVLYVGRQFENKQAFGSETGGVRAKFKRITASRKGLRKALEFLSWTATKLFRRTELTRRRECRFTLLTTAGLWRI